MDIQITHQTTDEELEQLAQEFWTQYLEEIKRTNGRLVIGPDAPVSKSKILDVLKKERDYCVKANALSRSI